MTDPTRPSVFLRPINQRRGHEIQQGHVIGGAHDRSRVRRLYRVLRKEGVGAQTARMVLDYALYTGEMSTTRYAIDYTPPKR